MNDILIFTDGSSDLDLKLAGSGFIINDLDSKKTYEGSTSYPGKTNNYTELISIKNALDALSKIRDINKKIRITIVSDSKLCCETFTSWVYKWSKKGKNELWETSNGLVANQEIIKYIFYNYIKDDDYNIRFIHMNSHLKSDKSKDILKVKEKFKLHNIILTDLQAKTMIDFNNRVDVLAEECYKDEKNNALKKKRVGVI